MLCPLKMKSRAYAPYRLSGQGVSKMARKRITLVDIILSYAGKKLEPEPPPKKPRTKQQKEIKEIASYIKEDSK